MTIPSPSMGQSFSSNDVSLMSEAYRRVQASRYPHRPEADAVLGAILAEMRNGRRDLFSLVKAGTRAGPVPAAKADAGEPKRTLAFR